MKGQFFLLGFILIGLTIVTLSFSTFEATQDQLNPTLKNDIENSVPEAVEAFGQNYRGKEFMEMMQYFADRHKQESVGEQIRISVVSGFEKNRNLELYLGNYGELEKQFNISVNSQNTSKTLESGEITKIVYPISESYSVDIESENFQENLNLTGPSFFLVNHRYQKGAAVSQDTYIG